MRKQGQVLLLLFSGLLIFGIYLAGGSGETPVIRAGDPEEAAHLPAIFKPENSPTPGNTPTPEPTVEPTVEPTPEGTPEPGEEFVNGSFELGWTDVDGDKQQPNGWELTWVKKGEPLYDSADLATNSCECLHRMGGPDPDPDNPPRPDLPPNEWFGGPDALILDGLYTYKAFRQNASWGTQMSQAFDLPPGTSWRVSAPVQMHDQTGGVAGGYDAESSLWVNNDGAWAQIGTTEMVDREWCKHEQTFVVPADGQVQIDIRFKVKYELSIDFFIDHVQVLPGGSADPYPDFPPCVDPDKPLRTYKPYRR